MRTLAQRRPWKLERDGGGSIQALKSMHWAERRDGEARKAGLGRRRGREKSPPTAQLPHHSSLRDHGASSETQVSVASLLLSLLFSPKFLVRDLKLSTVWEEPSEMGRP